MPHILTWQVTGMTCRSCEKVVGDVLREIPGAMETNVSLKMSKATVRLRDDAHAPELEAINKKLSPQGYVLYPEGCAIPASREKFRTRLYRALPALASVAFVLFLLSPFRSLVPSVSAGASLGAVLFLGIVASVSSCLATTGGFMLAYSAEAGSRRKTVFMHVGRLLAFAIGGAAFGAIGGALPSGSVLWYGALALILGVGFLAVSLNLLDLSPSLAKMGIALPSSIHAYAEHLRKRPGTVAPLFVGAVTFILPCGFTQTAQALALASGSWEKGMFLMLAFALGTLPVLLGVTTFATKATMKHRTLRLAAGAIMFFFAIGQIQSGLALFGVPVDIGVMTRSFQTIQADAAPSGDVQIVQMNVTSYGYVPSSFKLRKNVPVRWEINGESVSGCTNAIVSRQLGISRVLKPGMNVIEFTPTKAGTISFACSMGMVRGTFTVI